MNNDQIKLKFQFMTAQTGSTQLCGIACFRKASVVRLVEFKKCYKKTKLNYPPPLYDWVQQLVWPSVFT